MEGGGVGEKPLRRIAEAFEGLAEAANCKTASMEVAPFSRACSHVSVLFGCLGIAFKFAEMDYVAKVEDLSKASNSISTLHSLLELDIQQDSVKRPGSHSRNLLRVKRGLDMVKILFEQILVTDGNSLKDPASKAYAKVFAPHHGWAIRKAVAAGMLDRAMPNSQDDEIEEVQFNPWRDWARGGGREWDLQSHASQLRLRRHAATRSPSFGERKGRRWGETKGREGMRKVA
ncbi:Glycolipid transfer protein (GLTP) [Musa troglodytarum]|uniref:Glycolipid transfer protein (GLTP) n=1 Tax=Musa troglodytarum TaxID=320322 RepID=A0A9E7FST1_9LILI|nr:Glycolipid transfer protein (GLTP) [Musa troglodytarum]